MTNEEIGKIEKEIISLLKKHDLNYSKTVYILKDLIEKMGSQFYIK